MANTSSSRKRAALAFGGAALLLCSTVGLSQAQSAAAAKPTRQQQQAVINLAATKLGLSGDQLSEALKSSRKDLGLRQRHAALATSRVGSPTPVANALKADIDSRIQAMITAGTLKAARATTLTHKAETKVDALMTRQFKAARKAQG
jgi:hypothetical protein